MNRILKNFIRTITVVGMLFCILSVRIYAEDSIVAEGICGESVNWTLTSDGTITISGNGAMWDYEYEDGTTNEPWYYYKNSINKVIVEDGVTHIGAYSFYEYQKMTEVVIGNDVVSIGQLGFSNSNYVTKLTIGENLRKEYGNAFNGWVRLEELYISNLEAFCNIEGDIPGGCPLYLNEIEIVDLVIPESVTKINDSAFAGYSSIKTVTIHENVEYIGEDAFFSSYIEKVYFEGDMKQFVEITRTGGNYSWLYSPDIYVEGDLVDDVVIPEGTSYIGDYAFYNCTSLKNISMPESVKAVGKYAFATCDSLAEISVAEGIEIIEEGAFDACNVLNSVVLPDSIETVKSNAFRNCTNLQSIVLSENLEKVLESVFEECNSLSEVKIPASVQTIEKNAFYNCTSLSSIEFTEGVLDTIGENAFYNCNNIGNTELPSSLKIIGTGAFENCSSMDIAKFPLNLETIGASAFENCCSLTKVELGEKTINLGEGTFTNCSGVTSVILSDDMEVIPESAFEGCTGFSSIILPVNLNTISQYAFSDCTSLSEITFVGDPPSIADYAFKNVKATCYYPGDNEKYTEAVITPEYGGDLVWTYDGLEITNKCGKNIKWQLSDDGILSITGTGEMYDYSVEDLSYAPWYDVRSSVNEIVIGEGITHVGNATFYDCSSATKITIPSSVVSIGNNAFYNLAATSVELPDNLVKIGDYAFKSANMTNIVLPDTVTDIGIGVFYGTNLENAVLPDSLAYIPDSMFERSFYLKTVELPEKLKTIGNNAFNYCIGLHSMVLPEGLISIGENAFASCGCYYTYGSYYDCSNFTSITLPSTLETIGKGAFWYCQSLETIEIPDRVKVIEANTFGNCYDLESVTLPTFVTSIGKHAFIGCKSLSTMVFKWNAPEILEDIFTTQVSANCYYPTNNASWTSDKFQNYGAKTLTWNGQTVNEPKTAEITEPIESQEVKEGSSAIFNVGAAGDEVTYQWQCSTDGGQTWFDLKGNNTSELTIPANNGTNGNMYRCVVTDKYGNSVVSDAASITVQKEELAIVKQPENQSVNINETAVFTIEATGTNLSYQWQYSNSNGAYWYDSGMEGAKTNTINVPAIEKRDGQLYRCIVTDNNSEVVSNSAMLTIIWQDVPFEIVTQPKSQTVSVGIEVKFVVEVTGEELSYQWQYSNSDGKYWYNSGMTGFDTNTIGIVATTKRNGYMYRCQITDAEGNVKVTDAAMLTILEDTIEIVSQPKDQTVGLGKNAQFTVEATGDGLKYQWQYKNSGSTYWFDSGMEGNDAEILYVPAELKRNGQMYRCVITNEDGKKVITDEVTLNVVESSIIIIAQPENQTADIGEQVSFVVEAEGEELTYQWEYSKNGMYWFASGMEGNDTNTLKVTATANRNGQMYRCAITDADGNVIRTEEVTLNVK